MIVPARRCNEERGIRVFTKSMLTTRGSAVAVHGRRAAAAVRASNKACGMIIASSSKAKGEVSGGRRFVG